MDIELSCDTHNKKYNLDVGGQNLIEGACRCRALDDKVMCSNFAEAARQDYFLVYFFVLMSIYGAIYATTFTDRRNGTEIF